MPAKVIVVGLDSGEASLLERWGDEGVLPTFAELQRESRRFDLGCRVSRIPTSVWPEISMGRSIGRHGHYEHSGHIHSGEARPRGTRPDEIDAERYFWSVASRAGRRVAVVDVPFAAANPRLNGIQVQGWYLHANSDLPRVSWPAGILEELEDRHGRHPGRYCDDYPHTVNGLRHLADDLSTGLRRRKELLLDVLGREHWDLFCCSFAETHCIGHHFWHLIDGTHDVRRHPTAPDLAAAAVDLHRLIDDTIGELIDAAGPEATVLVLTSHGMRRRTGGQQVLSEVLIRLGMQGHGDSPIRVMGRAAYQKATEPIRRYRWKDVVEGAARSGMGRAVLAPLRSSLGAMTYPLESADTKAVISQNNMASGVRLNLAGRDPNGRVEPGAEADRLLDEIAAELERLVDPAAGRPIVTRVVKSADLFGPSYHADLPDLLIELSTDLGTIEGARSPRVGTVRIGLPDRDWRRTGAHRASARLWARGPHVHHPASVAEGDVLDIAPTVLRLLDVALPNDLDGAPLRLDDTTRRLAAAE
jgi:predicted AlkP superfamily phosphohydrolase/phosphomutase